MTRMPLVSAVMPFYNARDTIDEAIRSLRNQTYGDIELILVDDGSTDRSAEIVASYGDPRVRTIRQHHLGLVPALRQACAAARGAYVARLDADDVAAPHRVATQVAYLEEHQDIGLVGSYAKIEDETGGVLRFEPPTTDASLRRYLLWDNPFVHSSVMFKRSLYDVVGGYTVGPNEDYRLWIRMAQVCRLAVIPEVLVFHRIRGASYSRTLRRAEALRARLAAQWDAALRLGPWHRALPALAMTGGTYVAALAGWPADAALRTLVRGAAGRARGLRRP